jgi:hypothetical protein
VIVKIMVAILWTEQGLSIGPIKTNKLKIREFQVKYTILGRPAQIIERLGAEDGKMTDF